MSGGGGGGEKTEKATPKRRKKARRDGQIGNTPELGTWAGFLVATFLLPGLFKGLVDVGRTAIVQVGSVIQDPEPGLAMAVAADSARAALGPVLPRPPRAAPRGAFGLVLPLASRIAVIGFPSAAVQGGIWFSPKLLKPQAKRL